MRLHLRPIPAQRHINRDTYSKLHKQLESELIEERISRELTDRRNDRLRRSERFKATGSLET